MRVLVIPDVHLKPIMFRKAAHLLRRRVANNAVCLMDIADDWDKQYNIGLYEETYDETIRFSIEFQRRGGAMGTTTSVIFGINWKAAIAQWHQ